MSTAYANRPEIRSLELATQIYKQKINVTQMCIRDRVDTAGMDANTEPNMPE